MKRCVKRWCAGVSGLLLLAWFPCALAQEPIEDLRVPMEYYEDGTLKSELFAGRAEMRSPGTIAVWGIVFRLFTALGIEEVVLRAEEALINREAQVAVSRRPMSMQRGNLKITGDSFTWNGKEGILLIQRNARVTFPSGLIQAEGVLNRVQ